MATKTKADIDRKHRKANAIEARLIEMRGNEEILLALLDETKLDLMILALGIGSAVLTD